MSNTHVDALQLPASAGTKVQRGVQSSYEDFSSTIGPWLHSHLLDTTLTTLSLRPAEAFRHFQNSFHYEALRLQCGAGGGDDHIGTTASRGTSQKPPLFPAAEVTEALDVSIAGGEGPSINKLVREALSPHGIQALASTALPTPTLWEETEQGNEPDSAMCATVLALLARQEGFLSNNIVRPDRFYCQEAAASPISCRCADEVDIALVLAYLFAFVEQELRLAWPTGCSVGPVLRVYMVAFIISRVTFIWNRSWPLTDDDGEDGDAGSRCPRAVASGVGTFSALQCLTALRGMPARHADRTLQQVFLVVGAHVKRSPDAVLVESPLSVEHNAQQFDGGRQWSDTGNQASRNEEIDVECALVHTVRELVSPPFTEFKRCRMTLAHFTYVFQSVAACLSVILHVGNPLASLPFLYTTGRLNESFQEQWASAVVRELSTKYEKGSTASGEECGEQLNAACKLLVTRFVALVSPLMYSGGRCWVSDLQHRSGQERLQKQLSLPCIFTSPHATHPNKMWRYVLLWVGAMVELGKLLVKGKHFYLLMGRKAAFTKAWTQDVQHKHHQREQRSQVERDKRRGNDNTERKIQRVVVQRSLPCGDDVKLLLTQFSQACRLPAPCGDLCSLMRSYVGENADSETSSPVSRKRSRPHANLSALEAMADAFLRTQSTPADGNDGDDEEEPQTILEEVLQDDSGRRVATTLLASLSAVGSKKSEAVAKVILEQFEENEHLSQHYVACRLMSALVQHGTEEIKSRVLNLLRLQGTTLEGIRELLSNRHTSITVEYLLQHLPKETTAWLCEVLSLRVPAASKKKVKRVDQQVSTDVLYELIHDPVSGQVMRQLINSETRNLFLTRLDIATLLETKRGTTFLSRLLAIVGEEEVDPATLDGVLEKTSTQLPDMCVDKRANFVVQGIMELIPFAGERSIDYFTQLLRALGPSLTSLTNHAIGVHVVTTLIDVAFKLPKESIAEEVAGLVLNRHNIDDMMCSSHGSLVVRRLMPLITRKSSTVGQLLSSSVEQNMFTLVYNALGNLVAQEYLKAVGPAGTASFVRRVIKSADLLNMCRHPSAAHVVCTLLSVVDPTTHVALCNALKPHVIGLATHLNGRFIIEKLIPANREVRNEVAHQFLSLAYEKGVQHVLCALAASMDARGLQNIIEKAILPNLASLATHACASIVLQKLMQSQPSILTAVHKELSTKGSLRSDLAQNFYGKFVVQIAINQEGA